MTWWQPRPKLLPWMCPTDNCPLSSPPPPLAFGPVLYCTALHCTALHCTALHFTELPCRYAQVTSTRMVKANCALLFGQQLFSNAASKREVAIKLFSPDNSKEFEHELEGYRVSLSMSWRATG